MERLRAPDAERFLLRLIADRRSGALDKDRFLVNDITAGGTGDRLLVTAERTSKEYDDASEGLLSELGDAGLLGVHARGSGWEVVLLPAAFNYGDWLQSSSLRRAAVATSSQMRKYAGWAALVLIGAILGQAGSALWSWLTGLTAR